VRAATRAAQRAGPDGGNRPGCGRRSRPDRGCRAPPSGSGCVLIVTLTRQDIVWCLSHRAQAHARRAVRGARTLL